MMSTTRCNAISDACGNDSSDSMEAYYESKSEGSDDEPIIQKKQKK